MSALGRSSATPKVSRPEKHAKKSTKRGFRVVGGHFLLSHIKIYKGTVYIYIYSIYIYASFVKSLLDHLITSAGPHRNPPQHARCT